MSRRNGFVGALRLLGWQAVITLLLSLVMLFLMSIKAAKSALLGGLVSIIPNAVFACKLFHHEGARSAQLIVKSFYQGEVLKVVLAILLFALVFNFTIIEPIVFFVTYIVVQMICWFAPLIMINTNKRPESD